MGAGSGVTGSGFILFHPEQREVLQMGLEGLCQRLGLARGG